MSTEKSCKRYYILNIEQAGFSPELFSSLLWFLFISAKLVSIFIGVFIIPVGAFAGYVIARKRSEDPIQLPVISMFKEDG